MIALAMACQLAVAPMMPSAAQAAVEPESEQALSTPPASLLTDRKTLPAAMSLVVPGSGQLLQGQNEKGALHLAAAGTLLLLMATADAQKDNVSSPSGTGANVRVLSALGLLGLALWSPVDAWLFGANNATSP